MKIIWLTPEVVYPPIGGRNGVYNRIVQMSKMNDIFLFSISYNAEEEGEALEEMKQYCKSIFHYNRGAHKYKTLIKSLFLPFSVASRTSRLIQKEMKRIIKENKIDYIIVDFPDMALNVLKIKKYLKGIKVTLNEHNIEFERMRSMKDIKTISAKKRLMYKLESKRLLHYEKRIYKQKWLDSITFFSNDDAKKFPSYFPRCKAKIAVFPLGANDLDILPTEDNQNLIFIGRLDEIAITNVEAVLWFKEAIFPRILEKFPKCKLIVAGSKPSNRILSLESENIHIIPNYDKVENVFSLGDCVILPLLSGGGVKGKILEAAASKKMIITTQKGVEGTLFEHKKDLIEANDAESFANAVIDYLSNKAKYKLMAESAYKVFHDNYRWPAVVKKYNEFLTERI